MNVASADRRNESGRLDELALIQRDELARYAFVLAGNAHDAEEILQAVLVRLSSRDLKDVDNLAAFATRAVTNEFLSGKRRLHRGTRLQRRLTRERPASGVDIADRVAERDLLRWALEPLKARQRAAVTLRYLHDFDDASIAEALDCAPGTVRSLISRALPVVRARLDKWED